MRGHVIKKDGNWYVVLELEREDGRRRQKWISVRKELNLPKPANKKQAEELLTHKLKELHDGTFIEPAKMTLGAWLRRWVSAYCRVNLRRTTCESYESFIDHHILPALGHMELTKLRPLHIQELLSHKIKNGRADGKEGGLSPRSVKYIHTILHEALKHAVKLEIVPRNVAEAVTPPRETKAELQVWDVSQVNAFLEAASKHRLYPLFLLALTTGMRRGELLGLRWQDIDWKRKTISVCQTLVVTKEGIQFQEPKTNAGKRVIAVDNDVLEVLKFWRIRQTSELTARQTVYGAAEKNSLLVFCSIAGTPVSPRNLARIFETLIKKAKVPPLSLHGLRHTSATLMLKENIPAKVVSERLGHSKVGITLDTYSHVLPDMQREAADKISQVIKAKLPRE